MSGYAIDEGFMQQEHTDSSPQMSSGVAEKVRTTNLVEKDAANVGCQTDFNSSF